MDTNVLISALGWDGSEAAIIELVFESRLKLFVSAQILSEFYRVTRYPKFNFTEQEVDGFAGRLLHSCQLVNPVLQVEVISEDPDDNRVLECALAGECEFIISGDKHLLSLKEYQGIIILKAPEFLKVYLERS